MWHLLFGRSCSVHFSQSLFQVLCDLIRAAGAAEAAFYILKAFDDLFGFHAANDAADALQVTVDKVPHPVGTCTTEEDQIARILELAHQRRGIDV